MDTNSFRLSNIVSLIVLLSIFLIGFSAPGSAQEQPFIVRGDAAVTGFSGTTPPTTPLAPGTRAIDETFIDLNGKVMRLFSLADLGGPATAAIVNATPSAEISAGDVGQVFGAAFDDGIRAGRSDRVPNLYLTATSMFGLQIVIADRDGDGRPERVRTGRPGARWMAGQFGTRAGGGPGAIWKLDGLSGQISLFANLVTEDVANRGGALGNIAFDPRSRHLYVSDLETGLITAFDLQGNALYAFDHGINGRPNKDLDPVADDSSRRADITSPDFDAEDPDTWGYADPRRRVFGLGVRKGRLYYAIKGPLSIWSVALNKDGSFGGAGRWEFDVTNTPKSNDVTDITFDTQGRLYIAQRGKPAPRYDYSSFAKPRRSVVRIYSRERPDNVDTPSRWIEDQPKEPAIGFPVNHRNTTGGVALGYGYNKQGRIKYGACRRTLWTSGEHLRESAEHGATLVNGGPLFVHGLQANDKNLVRPQNTPPWKSWFIDFDGQYQDSEVNGHIGDVEIFSYCPPGRAAVRQPRPDLKITKRATSRRCFAGKDCEFDIIVENVSTVPYRGPLYIQDGGAAGALIVDFAPRNAAWNCEPTGYGTTLCKHAPLTLRPGKRVKLSVTAALPKTWKGKVFRNCAAIKWWGQRPDARRRNDSDCAYVATCKKGDKQCTPDIKIEKHADTYLCDDAGRCNFWIEALNVGAAPFTGKIRLKDQFLTPGATVTNFGPAPDWSCIAGTPLRCTHRRVTLNPGDGVWLNVEFQLPPPALAVPGVYKNCAATKTPIPGSTKNYSPLNDYSCAKVAYCPPGAPAGTCLADLEITKVALNAVCLPGSTCRFGIEVRNVGTAEYVGPIEVNDPVAATGMTFVGNSAGWTCDDLGGTRQCRVDTVPAGAAFLAPGDSAWLELEFAVPAGYAAPFVQNCASMNWPGPSDTNPGNDGPSCAAVPTTAASPLDDALTDWSISKSADQATCNPSASCYFTVQVTNHGPGDYFGIPGFADPMPEGLSFQGTDPLSPWTCNLDAGIVNCSLPTGGVSVPPGDMPPVQLEYRVNPAFAGGVITNTATVHSDAEIDPNFANNSSSASVIVVFPAPVILPLPNKSAPPSPPSLAMSKTGPATVKPGQTVSVQLRLANRGQASLAADFNISETFKAGRYNRARILSISPSLGCRPEDPVQAPGNCTAKIELGPRKSRSYTLRIRMPSRLKAGDTGTSCTSAINRDNGAGSTPDLGRVLSGAAGATAKGYACWTFIVGRKPIRITDPAPTAPVRCALRETRTRSGNCVCKKGYRRASSQRCIKIKDQTTPTLRCNTGWTKFKRSRDFPKGWLRSVKRRNGKRILCGKAPRRTEETCRAPFKRIGGACGCPAPLERWRNTCLNVCLGDLSRNFAGQCACPKGQTRRGSKCFTGFTGDGDTTSPGNDSPPPLNCPRGWTKYWRSNAVPKGWKSFVKGKGARRIYCARRSFNNGTNTGGTNNSDTSGTGLTTPPSLNCPKGWTRYASKRNIPKGWKRLSKRRGRNRIYCGKPRFISEINPGLSNRVTCSGGRVYKGVCRCPAGKTRSQTGKNSYRCKTNAAASIRCDNGRISNGRCYCSRGYSKTTIGRNAWRCKKAAVTITLPRPKCVNGRLSKYKNKWSCRCSRGSSLRNGVCSKNAPKIRCDNGYIRSGQCRCAKSRTRQNIGRNAWRCVRKTQTFQPARVSCSGGSVRNGRCYCARGKNRVKTGKNSYACRTAVQKFRPQLQIKPKFNNKKYFNPKTLKYKPI